MKLQIVNNAFAHFGPQAGFKNEHGAHTARPLHATGGLKGRIYEKNPPAKRRAWGPGPLGRGTVVRI